MRQNFEKYAAGFGKICDLAREICGNFFQKYNIFETPFNIKEITNKVSQFATLHHFSFENTFWGFPSLYALVIMGFFGYVKNQSRTQVRVYLFKIIIGAYNEGKPILLGYNMSDNAINCIC